MAGLFDFDKTLLAALDARQKRNMYEQERADKNAIWQQSFDLQNKEFLERARQFRETIAENQKQRDFTATQNELNRKRDMEGENFKFRSQLSEDKWGIGTKGSVLENALGRDFGDTEFEGKSWVTAQDLNAYLTQQGLQEERNRTALGWETLRRTYPEPDTGSNSQLDIPYDETFSMGPISPSAINKAREQFSPKTLGELQKIDASAGPFSMLSPQYWGSQLFESLGGKTAPVELQTKRKDIIETQFKSIEDKIYPLAKQLKNRKTISTSEAAQILGALDAYRQRYLTAPYMESMDAEGKPTISGIEGYPTSLLETYIERGKYTRAIEEKDTSYEDRLNSIANTITSLQRLVTTLPKVETKSKSDYFVK